MKKIIMTMLLAMIAMLPMAAKDRISRDVKDLPVAAQTMIDKYFPNESVSMIKIDEKAFGNREYEVVLTNGTEIEFDKEGAWKEVDCGRRAVPSDLVLTPIRQYVKDNFNSREIVHIESSKNKYEVELRDGTDLEFDRSGKFLRIDY